MTRRQYHNLRPPLVSRETIEGSKLVSLVSGMLAAEAMRTPPILLILVGCCSKREENDPAESHGVAPLPFSKLEISDSLLAVLIGTTRIASVGIGLAKAFSSMRRQRRIGMHMAICYGKLVHDSLLTPRCSRIFLGLSKTKQFHNGRRKVRVPPHTKNGRSKRALFAIVRNGAEMAMSRALE